MREPLDLMSGGKIRDGIYVSLLLTPLSLVHRFGLCVYVHVSADAMEARRGHSSP